MRKQTCNNDQDHELVSKWNWDLNHIWKTPKLMLFLHLLFQIVFIRTLHRNPLRANLRDGTLAWPCLGLLQLGQPCFCRFVYTFWRDFIWIEFQNQKQVWKSLRHSSPVCFCACPDISHPTSHCSALIHGLYQAHRTQAVDVGFLNSPCYPYFWS